MIVLNSHDILFPSHYTCRRFVPTAEPEGVCMQEKHMSFERLVATIQDKATIQCTESLLRRLAGILAFRSSEVMSDVSKLMKRLYPKSYQEPHRYPPRVFLCAYMILSCPEVGLAGAHDLSSYKQYCLIRWVQHFANHCRLI